MYKIEITTRNPISEKQKNVLQQSVHDADPAAVCQMESTSCKINGSGAEPEQLSYLLGIATGSSASSEIIRLLLVYEKN